MKSSYCQSPNLSQELPRHFEELWQAQIFALVVALQESGEISLNEWGDAVSHELQNEPNTDVAGNEAYYQAWTRALERLVVSKGLAGPLQLTQLRSAWRLAAEKTPHGKAIELATNHLQKPLRI